MGQEAVPPPRISVAIVEDDAVTRSLLSLAIESEPAFALIAAFDRARSAIAWLASNQPDLLLTDLGLPDGSGVEVIRACARYTPDTSIMVISMSSDEDEILSCIEAGASGYVLKDAGRTDIVQALLDLHAGGSPISPIIARKVLARMRGVVPARPAVDRRNPGLLTNREASILELIARGDSYGEVAVALCLSVGTVQTHVKNIYGKLSVHSRGEAVYEAQRRGLLRMNLPKLRK
ncbi:response regulator [Lacisediminimonas profundi]|uniref:response regulator n=1 Tax=Lacisediminimonas profundi TaxID=2603856 RepID=UPI00124B0D57|nr:response regulator transcription factor [Lacisediminimonas profundi]